MRLGELEGIVGEEDGYSAESDAAIVLQGLDIPHELHERTMAELQGGQKMRVLLAQALFGHPEALLLDEPTNHLDLDSIHWLCEFLTRYDGTLIVTLARSPFPQRRLHPHGRHRLRGDHHLHRRLRRHGRGQDADPGDDRGTERAAGEENRQLNDFIARFSAGTRSSQVQSRRKEVERLQTTELARSNIQRPYIKFGMARPTGRVALECARVEKAFGGLRVVSKFSAIVNRGDKVVIVGRNGAGKTTLLKALLSDAPGLPGSGSDLDSGRVRWGHEASIGYFPQDHTGAITKGMTSVEWLHQFDPGASRQEIHGLLGQMLFSGEEGHKPTAALSGGETARLLFRRIMLQKPNVLLLDEPTNHLDLESINALNIALQKFEGTILVVTHDQDLMEEVGTRVWHGQSGAVTDFKGTWEEYSAAQEAPAMLTT